MTALGKSLWASMAIQSLGAISTLGIGLVIATWQGPAAQGHYGLVRSTADLLLALALFGLPQSLVHAVHRQRASAAALMRWGARYAAALLLLALLVSVSVDSSLVALGPASAWVSVALLVGTAGWVLQGLQRVLVLCLGSAVSFAWMSSAPALTLLLGVLVLVGLGRSDFELAVLGSGLISVGIGYWHLRSLRTNPEWARGERPDLRSLLSDGLYAFAQTGALALQPWITLQLMRLQGATTTDLGHFVFAAYVYQVFALPASFVAPLLLVKASRAAGSGEVLAVDGLLRPAFGITFLISFIAAVSVPFGVTTTFGETYSAASWACVWMALSGPALLANRLGVSVLMGRGQFTATNIHAIWRVVALLLTMEILGAAHISDTVSKAAFVWFTVECLCAVSLWVMWKFAPFKLQRSGK